jgi:hypothetical protein
MDRSRQSCNRWMASSSPGSATSLVGIPTGSARALHKGHRQRPSARRCPDSRSTILATSDPGTESSTAATASEAPGLSTSVWAQLLRSPPYGFRLCNHLPLPQGNSPGHVLHPRFHGKQHASPCWLTASSPGAAAGETVNRKKTTCRRGQVQRRVRPAWPTPWPSSRTPAASPPHCRKCHRAEAPEARWRCLRRTGRR